MSQPHETLVAWQRADDLCVATYRLTRDKFPREERYALAAQLRRAAYSSAANIVEGYAFPEGPTRVRFLRIALASLAEVGYCFHLAWRVGHISEQEYRDLLDQTRRVAAPLHGLLRRAQSGCKRG